MSKKYTKLFLQAIMAGFSIGLGATAFLRVKDTFDGGMVAGALLFCVGLYVVCTRGYALFTGRACTLFDNSPAYLIDLAIIWIGNLVGNLILALGLRMTSICGETGIDATAAGLVAKKMDSSLLSLFVLGIVCNIFIFIAVNAYNNNPHEVGKYMAIILGVTCFIFAGSEHCIADQFYWAVSGVLFTQPGKSLLCLLVITLGNMVGAVLFPQMEKLIKSL